MCYSKAQVSDAIVHFSQQNDVWASACFNFLVWMPTYFEAKESLGEKIESHYDFTHEKFLADWVKFQGSNNPHVKAAYLKMLRHFMEIPGFDLDNASKGIFADSVKKSLLYQEAMVLNALNGAA